MGKALQNLSLGTVLIAVSLLGVGCSQVTSQKLAPKTYTLSTQVNGVPSDFDRRSLSHQADKVCPQGYNVLSKSFTAHHAMANSQISCLEGQNCLMDLKWKIYCTPKQKRPFSIFGNT